MSDISEKLKKLLFDVPCESECEGELGSCPDRKYGKCKRMDRLEYCTVQKIADHLLANGVTVQEWIPASEPPKKEFEEFTKGTDWDVYPCLASVRKTDGGRYVTKLFYDGKRFVNSEWVCYTLDVTHWMPLPEPPKGE